MAVYKFLAVDDTDKMYEKTFTAKPECTSEEVLKTYRLWLNSIKEKTKASLKTNSCIELKRLDKE